MKTKNIESQLDLFHYLNPKILENQIKRLEQEITRTIRVGDLKRAAALAEEQRSLIVSQIQFSSKPN